MGLSYKPDAALEQYHSDFDTGSNLDKYQDDLEGPEDRLFVVEAPKESASTQFVDLSALNRFFCLPSSSADATDREDAAERIKLEQPAAQSAQASTSSSPVEISRHAPQACPISNPALVAVLEDFTKDINNLTILPSQAWCPPRHDPTTIATQQATVKPPTEVLPNVAITIKINPSHKRNFDFLAHLNAALSSQSKLDITGPPAAVEHLISNLHSAQKQHLKQAKQITEYENQHTEYAKQSDDYQAFIVKQYTEMDNLRNEVNEIKRKGAGVCGVKEHKGVKEMLQMREQQY